MPMNLLHLVSWSSCLFLSGIKKYIVGLIIKTSSDPNLLEREKVYLGKLNMILVQVGIFLCKSVFFSGLWWNANL